MIILLELQWLSDVAIRYDMSKFQLSPVGKVCIKYARQTATYARQTATLSVRGAANGKHFDIS